MVGGSPATRPSAREIVYALMAAAGVAVTWYFNLRFMAESGGSFSVLEFVRAAYANNAAASIANDIAVAALAFLVWSHREANRLGMKHWWAYVGITFAVAFACSYPLFLLMRERRMRVLAAESAGEIRLDAPTADTGV